MKRRMLLMLLILGAVVALLGGIKFVQISGAIKKGKSWRPPPEAVTTTITQSQEWSSSVQAIGSVVAVHGVQLSADLPGLVHSIRFESGRPVAAGEVLVELDDRQEQAQLAAAKAQWGLAKVTLDRAQKLVDQKLIAQSEFDQASANYKQIEANVGEIEATIQRKHVRAPFAGVAGIRQVNLGQYLSSGQPIVQLQSLDPIYVDFDVPQQDALRLRVGDVVEAAADTGAAAGLSGHVTAINSTIDPATRNLQIQATFHNLGHRLRPGMFVTVRVVLGASRPVIAVPATAISYAPYGNSVFVVQNIKGPDGSSYRGVQQRFIQIGDSRGDQVAVVSGLTPGEEVVSSGVFKLRNGVAVTIDNSLRPPENPQPRPANS